MGQILVVEDSRAQATRIKLELVRHGLNVAIATTGSEGLETARRLLPDAIILDIPKDTFATQSTLCNISTNPSCLKNRPEKSHGTNEASVRYHTHRP